MIENIQIIRNLESNSTENSIIDINVLFIIIDAKNIKISFQMKENIGVKTGDFIFIVAGIDAKIQNIVITCEVVEIGEDYLLCL